MCTNKCQWSGCTATSTEKRGASRYCLVHDKWIEHSQLPREKRLSTPFPQFLGFPGCLDLSAAEVVTSFLTEKVGEVDNLTELRVKYYSACRVTWIGDLAGKEESEVLTGLSGDEGALQIVKDALARVHSKVHLGMAEELSAIGWTPPDRR